MRTSNLANQSLRVSETGHVWEEKLSGQQGTLEINKRATFRVRALGATTVTIDGVLAATMSTGEIMLFNTGSGANDDAANFVPTVTVVIGGANAFVQVARDFDRKP
jgi:hypothetical protein